MVKLLRHKERFNAFSSNSRVRMKNVWKHRELYLFMLPALVALFIFCYMPMYGVVMAFQDVKIGTPIWQNEWVGFKHFERFFNSSWFDIVIKNTINISLLRNVLCWPFPVILALLLHNSTNSKIRKLTQTATYIPYLLSMVIIISILNVFCGGEAGLVNILLKKTGHDTINFFGEPGWTYPMYVISGIWQMCGYQAVVYIGALSGVDASLEEAAMIDGAGKFKRILHIQLPSILPTIMTMLILDMGKVMAVSADKMLLMQTDLNLSASEVLGTYVYKTGFSSYQYGFSTAIGLFQSVINLVLLLVFNKLSKKATDISVI